MYLVKDNLEKHKTYVNSVINIIIFIKESLRLHILFCLVFISQIICCIYNQLICGDNILFLSGKGKDFILKQNVNLSLGFFSKEILKSTYMTIKCFKNEKKTDNEKIVDLHIYTPVGELKSEWNERELASWILHHVCFQYFCVPHN